MTQVHVNVKGAVRIFKPKLNDSSFNFIFVNGDGSRQHFLVIFIQRKCLITTLMKKRDIMKN
jgi:hypothetical protein